MVAAKYAKKNFLKIFTVNILVGNIPGLITAPYNVDIVFYMMWVRFQLHTTPALKLIHLLGEIKHTSSQF